ncbi:glycosyltransferase family 4 protein [Sedimentitalea sp.]|uniref:glycosyltransferase family 4 protein n=1 Tax=Sedimentitalea sp. TaxID=2048915 RepID=UPI003299461D
MKIGLITPAWPGTQTANGITTAVSYLAHGLMECDHDVTIMAFSRDADFAEGNVILIPDLPWTFWQKLKARIGNDNVVHSIVARRIATTVLTAIRERGLDVVVMEETQGWGGWLQDLLPIPVVITLHGPWFMHKALQSEGTAASDKRREDREARALQTCAGITAPSRDVLNATQKSIVLSATVPQAVIVNPIPLHPAIPLEGMGAAARSSILFVGRFDRHKGGDTVIDSFALLAQSRPECRLTFVGPDRGLALPTGQTQTIKDRVAALPAEIRDRITYRGQCCQSEIAALRAEHGITLIASRYENLNYTMLEAMAAGSALVSTDVGGPGEVLEHERTALLVPPGVPEAMAVACVRLLDDPALAEQMAAAARALIQRDFLPAKVGADMAVFLAEVRSAYKKLS